MPDLAARPGRFALATQPHARPEQIVTGPHWRITVLTERLLRLERSASGTFTDAATQVIVHRDLGPAPFTATRMGDSVRIETSRLILDYDGGPFSPGGLSLRRRDSDGAHGTWHYAPDPPDATNFGGTARTLDEADGPVALEPGVCSPVGVAVLDDSRSLVLTDDWVAPRTRDAGDLDLYVFAHGRDFAGAVADLQRLAGPTPLLPRWALGNWWSRYHAYSDAEYRGLIERFAAEGLPFAVAVVDMDWHWVNLPLGHGSGWTGFSFNTDLFPDPPGFLAWLHERGLKVALNLHPADGVRSFEDAYPRLARRLGLDPDAGAPIPFDAADPDFLAAYLDEVLHPLEADGVDFWWLDWQQGTDSRMPGLDPLWALNHTHFADSGRDGRRPLTFSRYAGPGSHRYPLGFSGDTITSWESLAFQPFFTATAANIAYGWWSHDIGGHMHGVRDEELVTRWFQLGTFSPINRLHSTSSPFMGKEPWTFRTEHRDAMAAALRLRHRLLPYLHTMNHRAHAEGMPLVTPLYWEDPRPETLTDALTSFRFGSELLVAPITSPIEAASRTASVATWLPEGRWVDIFTGLRYAGGRRVVLHRTLQDYPVLARAGAIVPLQGGDELGLGNPEALELRVFAGADGTFTLVEDDDAGDPRVARTRFDWDDARGVLRIRPAIGAIDVVPATRRYTVRVSGLAPTRADWFASRWDAASASLVIDVGEVATAFGCVVRLAEPPTPGDQDVLGRVFAALYRAEVAYDAKHRAWDALLGAPDAAARLRVLPGLNLDRGLLEVLAEILLADAGA